MAEDLAADERVGIATDDPVAGNHVVRIDRDEGAEPVVRIRPRVVGVGGRPVTSMDIGGFVGVIPNNTLKMLT